MQIHQNPRRRRGKFWDFHQLRKPPLIDPQSELQGFPGIYIITRHIYRFSNQCHYQSKKRDISRHIYRNELKMIDFDFEIY